jgi:hypothetical protein
MAYFGELLTNYYTKIVFIEFKKSILEKKFAKNKYPENLIILIIGFDN